MPRPPIRTQSSQGDPWDIVLHGITDILNCKQSALSLSSLHGAVGTLVSTSRLDQLKAGLVNVMRQHFKTWTSELSQIAGNQLTVRFANIYGDFENYCRIIPKFYMLYDRCFQNPDGKSEIRRVVRELFVECVLSDKRLIKDMSSGIRRDIATARLCVEVDLGPVRKLLEMYYSFKEEPPKSAPSVSMFDIFFEDFKTETEQYYDDFYNKKFEGNSFPAYLQCCSEQFAHEEAIMKEILKPEHANVVLEILHKRLLLSREKIFIEGEEPPVSIALTSQDSRSIKWMVDTYVRFQSPLMNVFNTCAQYVKAQMLKLKTNFTKDMKTQETSRHVSELIELTRGLSQSYRLAFGAFVKAVEALDARIKEAWNDNDFDIVNNFCTYIDTQIRNEFQSLTAEERTRFPSVVAKFFTFTEDKKAFYSTYEAGMIRRFVKMQLKLLDLERPIIDAIRSAKAHDFVAQFDHYGKKINESQEIEAEFKQKLPDFFPEGKKTSITFSPLIFDARSFPLEKKEARCLPPECKAIHEAFVQWYKQQHPKTQLLLLADLSAVESKFHVPRNTKAQLARTYTVSSDLLCASIMDAVSQKPQTLREIHDVIPERNPVHQYLVRLCQSSCPILKRTANDKKLSETDIFELNPQFYFKTNRVVVQPIVSDKKIDRKTVKERVEVDKATSVKCAIVRVLKARQRVQQSVLENEVVQALMPYFRVEQSLIRRQLVDLEADQYFERVEENGGQVLIYLQ